MSLESSSSVIIQLISVSSCFKANLQNRQGLNFGGATLATEFVVIVKQLESLRFRDLLMADEVITVRTNKLQGRSDKHSVGNYATTSLKHLNQLINFYH